MPSRKDSIPDIRLGAEFWMMNLDNAEALPGRGFHHPSRFDWTRALFQFEAPARARSHEIISTHSVRRRAPAFSS